MITDKTSVIVEKLKIGDAVIIPTDTIYGFSCQIDSKKGIEQIFNLKKRESRPLLILDSSRERFSSYFAENEKIYRVISELTEANILGYGVTFVSDKNPNLNHSFFENIDTVAARLTNDRFINDLTEKLGDGVLSTSINLTGEPEITEISEIIEKFNDKLLIYSDGQEHNSGLPSLVLKYSPQTDEFTILRNGNKNIFDKVTQFIEKRKNVSF